MVIILGALDPLEGSIVILAAIGLVTFIARRLGSRRAPAPRHCLGDYRGVIRSDVMNRLMFCERSALIGVSTAS
jgi:hypothetical protein